MNRRSLFVFLALLAVFMAIPMGCCSPYVRGSYVAADRKKYETIGAYARKKVDEDEEAGKLTKIQADIKRKSLDGWEARIERAEEALKGRKEADE